MDVYGKIFSLKKYFFTIFQIYEKIQNIIIFDRAAAKNDAETAVVAPNGLFSIAIVQILPLMH